ncbi:MAG: hypothetical protein ACKOCM_05045 [Cyanobacteriota bacterium]
MNSTPIAPVVIDLAGDGFNFLARDAGVQFDYTGSGQKQGTAWAGGSDGILAYDLNQDGDITLSKEFVFTEWAPAALTDLEALAQAFDSNQDGLLSALDQEWSKFGTWIDANSNGISEAGEFVSLADLGIRSINLNYEAASTATTAASGDVTVAGTSLVTWEDGRTTQAADATFLADLPVMTLTSSGSDSVMALAADATLQGADPIAAPMATECGTDSTNEADDPSPSPTEQHLSSVLHELLHTALPACGHDLLTGLPLDGSIPTANPPEAPATDHRLLDQLEGLVDSLLQSIGTTTLEADWQALLAACWDSGGSDPRPLDPPWQHAEVCLQSHDGHRSFSSDRPLIL